MSLATRALIVAGLGVCGLASRLPAALSDDRALAATTIETGSFPKRLIDPLGGESTLRAPPRRIVSVSLTSDELLADLVGVDRLAGVTYLVDDAATTELAGRIPRSVPRTSEEPEALLALEPDLLVVAGYTRPETVRQLESAGVPVVRIGRHDSFDDVIDALTLLGRGVGEEARAGEIIGAMRARMHKVETAQIGRKSPRILIWEMGYSYGRGTLQDDLLRRAGARNVAAEAGLVGPVSLTEEALLSLGPDVIVTSIEGAEVRLRMPALLGDDPIVKIVPAVVAGRVYGVPRRWLGSVSQHAVRGLEALAEIVEDAR
ncbi:MAG: ABC transporter substrate-binding protein [Polyangiales bacterium]